MAIFAPTAPRSCVLGKRLGFLIGDICTFQAAAAAPAVPYFGVYLRDLTLLEHGNANHLQFGRIHVAKVRRMIGQLQSIREFQGGLYDQILVVPEVCGGPSGGVLQWILFFAGYLRKWLRCKNASIRSRRFRTTPSMRGPRWWCCWGFFGFFC
jgi:hypothetical protein